MLHQSISKNSVILGGFALVTAGILAGTFASTKEKISQEEKRAAERALIEIIPRHRHDNDMLSDIWVIPDHDLEKLGLESSSNINVAKQSGQPIAVIIPSTAPDGYSGDIKLIIGINIDGSIAGVRVLGHKETPGLGDKIDVNKDDWILGFNDKSLLYPHRKEWHVKKDGGIFDQFTGATITPRAVVKRVKNTLEYFTVNKADITGLEREQTQ